MPQHWEEQLAPDPKTTFQRNQLLRLLPPDDLALLDPYLERHRLEERDDFERPNQSVRAVWFIEAGIASVVARTPKGEKVEVGIIGCEGMTGQIVVMGDDRSPNECYMQVAGEGLCIPSGKLRAAMDESATMRPLFMRFAQTFTIQAAHTALANARGKLEERLARWLLMAHDRADGNDLHLTHEFLGMMLATHRPGVTIAVQALERAGLISARRSSITILKRKALEKHSDGAYVPPEG